MTIEEFTKDIILNPIIKSENGEDYILESDLEKLNLSQSEMLFVDRLIRDLGIKVYDSIKADRKKTVKDFEYGKYSLVGGNEYDKPTMSKIEYSSGELRFADFSELDKYLEEVFIPENITMVTVRSKNEPYPAIQLNKIVVLKLSELEIKHVLEYLASNDIKVRGTSQDLSEFENYDYISTYHYLLLPGKLEWEEQKKLFMELKETNDPVIREKLILSNMRLVPYVAFRVSRKYGYDHSELEQIGYESLIRAVDGFDISLGNRFSSYAVKCIKGEMLRGVEQTQNLPNYIYWPMKKLIEELEEEYQVAFSIENVAMVNELLTRLSNEGILKNNLSREAVNDALKLYESQSYDYMDESIGSSDVRVTEEIIANKELTRKIDEVLDTLKPIEKDVLKYMYGFDDGNTHSKYEASKVFGLTQLAIQQIEDRAIRMLRHPSRFKHIREFYFDHETTNDLGYHSYDEDSGRTR